jgi:hypothetical protein
LYALTGKPILVTEIYMAAAGNRSRNRNSTGHFPVVGTQAERAQSVRNTLHRLARVPYVVGVDWFQWADEPTHGRFDGENYNFGLVDIHDRVYEELTGMFANLDVRRIKSESSAASRILQGIPRGPENAFEDFVHFKAIKNWDRDRGFVKPQSNAPLADLSLCWRPNALYLAVHGWDGIESGYYRSRWVPKEDRAVWTVRIGGKEIARARIGGGREGLVSNPAVRVESIPVEAESAWMTAAMEVPSKVLGGKELGVGDEIELECTLLGHAGVSRVEWKGKFKLIE